MKIFLISETSMNLSVISEKIIPFKPIKKKGSEDSDSNNKRNPEDNGQQEAASAINP